MSNKQLTQDELLIIARTNVKKSKDDSNISAAKYFVIANDIKDGTEVVSAKRIYKAYIRWGKSKEIQEKIPFFKDFGKLFKKKRTKQGMAYLLNQTLIGKHNEKERKEDTEK